MNQIDLTSNKMGKISPMQQCADPDKQRLFGLKIDPKWTWNELESLNGKLNCQKLAE